MPEPLDPYKILIDRLDEMRDSIKNIERKIEHRHEDTSNKIERKLSVKTFWTVFTILITILVACLGGLYAQGYATYTTVIRLQADMGLIQYRMDYIEEHREEASTSLQTIH